MIANQIRIPKDVDLLSLQTIYLEFRNQLKRPDLLIDLIIPIQLTKDYLGFSKPNTIHINLVTKK